MTLNKDDLTKVVASYQDFRTSAYASESETIRIITRLAEESDIINYRWSDRGKAPIGYIKGMAVVFASDYCKLLEGDVYASEMAKTVTENNKNDSLVFYREKFGKVGLHYITRSTESLRQLFVLLLGLGMRESSGQWFEGRDIKAKNPTSEIAEAGLFQTSWNARIVSNLLPALFEEYTQTAVGYLEIFKEGLPERTEYQLEDIGEGEGKEFQHRSKIYPSFAVEFTAIALRNTFKHWGPIKRKEAEVLKEADNLFLKVQRAVDHYNLHPTLRTGQPV